MRLGRFSVAQQELAKLQSLALGRQSGVLILMSVCIALLLATGYHWHGDMLVRAWSQKGALEQDALIFYNRVPKCGSRSLTTVMRGIRRGNKLNVITSTTYDDHMNEEQLRETLKEIAELKGKTIYQKHMHFVNFTEYGYRQPVYINMIRDPVERFASRYNYRKYGDAMSKFPPETYLPNINDCVLYNLPNCTGEHLFVMGRYFCGEKELCMAKKVNRTMVELAKKNLDEEYLLVGLIEDFKSTLRLLERLEPNFFSGSSRAWHSNRESKAITASKTRDVLLEKARRKLRRKLWGEYQLYNFAKKKFTYLKLRYGI